MYNVCQHPNLRHARSSQPSVSGVRSTIGKTSERVRAAPTPVVKGTKNTLRNSDGGSIPHQFSAALVLSQYLRAQGAKEEAQAERSPENPVQVALDHWICGPEPRRTNEAMGGAPTTSHFTECGVNESGTDRRDSKVSFNRDSSSVNSAQQLNSITIFDAYQGARCGAVIASPAPATSFNLGFASNLKPSTNTCPASRPNAERFTLICQPRR